MPLTHTRSLREFGVRRRIRIESIDITQKPFSIAKYFFINVNGNERFLTNCINSANGRSLHRLCHEKTMAFSGHFLENLEKFSFCQISIANVAIMQQKIAWRDLWQRKSGT
jgi:hypothetical protein